jgi:ABC-2 type transport system ATP-binding protein
MTAIDATNLTKRYGETIAVDALDLTVPEGLVYGFLGPNGAGKTTTMQMLTTLMEPTDGTARIAGHPITEREAVAPHVGYLPDMPPLYDELTGREQLEYAAGLRDISNAHSQERIGTLLDRFDLTADADKRISTYSKGMKQKAGLIQVLLHDPEVVFLDEPTSGLDPRAAHTVRETIVELAASDATVFLSTHILPVVEEVADRVGVLYEGSLVAEGPPGELTEQADSDLEDIFLELTEERETEPVAAEGDT